MEELKTEFNFKTDGFVVIHDIINKEILKAAQKSVYYLAQLRYKNEFENSIEIKDRENLDKIILELENLNPHHKGFIYDTLPFLPELQLFFHNDPVLTYVRKTLSVDFFSYVSMINLNIRIDLPGRNWKHNKPWHQDYPYQNPLYAKGSSLVAWSPLFDCPLECGPVILKPGSHVLGEVSTIPIPREPGQSPEWTMDQKYVDDSAFEDFQIPINAGDLVLFDMNLIHKSGINLSENKIRWSVTTSLVMCLLLNF